MKIFTKTTSLVIALTLLATIASKAQCLADYTWSQTTNNVVDFTNTSQPITPNSTFFNWNFGDNSYGYTQDPSHTYNIPGTYYVCLTFWDSLSTCQSSFCDTITVFGNVLCNVTTTAHLIQPATCSTCPDGSASASMTNGTAPYTYAWSNGGTAQVESGLLPGSYSVCITDANGCQACDNITIGYVSNNCIASFTWSQTIANEIDFVSTSSNLSAQTGYYWVYGDNGTDFTNSTTASHQYTSAGTYIVCLYVSDSLNACYSYFCDTITVWGNTLPTNCDANFMIFPDSVNTQQAWGYNLSTGGPGMTYQWFWGDNTPVDYSQYPSHVYSATGSYNICLVVVDSANGCTDTMCQPIQVLRLSQEASLAPYFVNIIPATTGIQEQAQTTWTLYPNPAMNELKIKADYSLQGNIYRVLDVTGRVIASGKISTNSIDVSQFDKGMYIMQIENAAGGISVQRFMKN